MTAKDRLGVNRSYLASEGNFLTVKDLQVRNLIVPVVGDFAGTKTLRAIGNYVREHDQTIGLFYGSNVDDVLTPSQVLAFCANLETLPVHTRSIYIGGDTRGIGFEAFHTFEAVLQTCHSLQP